MLPYFEKTLTEYAQLLLNSNVILKISLLLTIPAPIETYKKKKKKKPERTKWAIKAWLGQTVKDNSQVKNKMKQEAERKYLRNTFFF